MKLDAMLSESEVCRVLSVPISCLGMAETLERLEALISAREPSLVVTADATALVIATENPSFRSLLDRAALITADGAGVLWAMKRQGREDAAKVSGVDLVDRLCALSAEKGYRIFFLGAAPGVAELAANRMRLRHPGVNIVGARHGYFSPNEDEEVAREVAQAEPDVLFVAMGMPRQEEFILGTQSIIRAPLAMGVGGSFDVFSGKTKRAPVWMQRFKLEWLWRLMLNPKKFGKVKLLPRFVRLVRKSKL